MEPENKTVNFGEIVEFECRVQSMHHLQLFIGNGKTQSQLYPHLSSPLGSRQFSVNVADLGNETVGKFWILINSNTTQVMEYFYCKVFYENFQVTNSRIAYINVIYPECTTQMSYQSTSFGDASSLPETTSESSQMFSELQGNPTSPPVIVESCLHKLSNGIMIHSQP